jgi:hypothetical protein
VHEELLGQAVYVDGANRPFGELTVDQVRARADELKSVGGWGPMARVLPVAMAWRELAVAMERAGAATVAVLPAEELDPIGPKLWVRLPGLGG